MPAFAIADVDRAEALDRPAHRALQRLEVRDVGLERAGAVAERRGELLEQLGLEADERDVRARRVQPRRDRGADAARGAGDEDRPARDVVVGARRRAGASCDRRRLGGAPTRSS